MPAASRSSSSTDVSTSKAYPSGATQAADLSLAQQKLKLARHSCCSASTSSSSRSSRRDKVGDTDGDAVELEEYEDGLRTPEPENGAGSGKLCNCRGFRPRPGTKVRAAPYSRNEREWGWGNSCGRCGHGIDSHGISSDAGGLEEDKAEEWLRRVKVAVRLDEMLEDQKKLLDWDYEDEDMQSLKKQMRVLGPTESTPMPRRRNGLDSRKRKSRSPADSMRLSSVEPSLSESSMAVDSPRSGSNAKRRRMQSRSATTSRYQSPAIATDGEAEGQGIGHGKMPSKSQKGLPPNGDGAAPTEDSRLATAHDDDEGKPKEYVEQDEADLEKVVQGVAMDTGAEENKPAVPPRRERPAIIEERSGLIQFRVVTNDGSPESMIILTGLKNIFQRQLPKMPREYITRLVLDRSHWSMAIVKRGLQVVGGITYRPFNSRKFAEIVFCAITGTEQVKGYGSHLMNHLKDHVKASSDVMHFLTYADNYAIGYFKKQGFTKEINLDRSIWVGYIKDYEGGTLMQCSMIPRVEYLKVQDLLAAQREAIVSKIRLMSRSHIVHPGLEVFRKPAEPKAKVEEIEEGQADEPMDPTAHFKVDPSEVPGLKESAWTIEMDELSRRPKRGPHHQLMRLIVSELSNHAASWPFTNPVNAQDVPDYYEVIKEPMDLSTMETKLENNQYSTIDDLLHDAQLIFDNCRVYNPATSVYAKSANRLERFVKDSLQGWKQQAGIL